MTCYGSRMKPNGSARTLRETGMLDREQTAERITTIRDGVRADLENEDKDRQIALERVDDELTGLLEDLNREDALALVVMLELLEPITRRRDVPDAASQRGDTYCRDCRADLWFNPATAKYVALFDAPCIATGQQEHEARR